MLGPFTPRAEREEAARRRAAQAAVDRGRAASHALMLHLKFNSPEHFQAGLTRVYFAQGVLEQVEARRLRLTHDAARTVARVLRGNAARQAFLRALGCVLCLQVTHRSLSLSHTHTPVTPPSILVTCSHECNRDRNHDPSP
jgi:myosin heavy subunit